MRPRKTDLKKVVNKRKRKKILADSKLNQSIRDMLEEVTDSTYALNDLLNETDTLAILNRVKINNFLNVYVTRIFDSLDGTQALNNRLLQKIVKKKEIVPSADVARMYARMRELENEQLKLVTEFAKAQEIKLDIPEQNMIIVYRSLPPTLQKLLYNTVMEFIRKCPAIQRELQKTNENIQENLQ